MLTDPEIAAELHSRAGFAAWVQPHWPAMARFAVRLVGPGEAEDVLQDALTLAWRKRHQFDAARGSARSWLLTLVADQARKLRRRFVPRVHLDDAPAEHVEPQVDRTLDLEQAVHRLSPRQKLAVDLYYYLDLPLAEVAAVMRCSQGTAKSTLADARARLRTYLGEEFR